MTASALYLAECDTLIIFPENPQFNQWITNTALTHYDPPSWVQDHWHAKHILINWSPVRDKYGFHVFRKPSDIMVVDTEAFKYLRGIMAGAKVKTNHIMIEDANDILIFKMMFAEMLK